MDVPGLWPGTEAPLLLFSRCVRLFLTLWTIARQAALSMGFPRQEYWSGLPFPSPGDLPNPEIKPRSPALQADSLLVYTRHAGNGSWFFCFFFFFFFVLFIQGGQTRAH